MSGQKPASTPAANRVPLTPATEGEHERSVRAAAVTVIQTLWPSVPVNEANLTADVAMYVFLVVGCLCDLQRVTGLLGGAIGLPTSYASIPITFVRMVIGALGGLDGAGWVTRAASAVHQENVRKALLYGTEVWPLEPPSACKQP